jgi:hypothetical protein
MRKKSRIAIDELLDYWMSISKQQTLTLDDFSLFFERMEVTIEYFGVFYGWQRPKDIQVFRTNSFAAPILCCW